MIDMEKLAELVKAATPGPWVYAPTNTEYVTHLVRDQNGYAVCDVTALFDLPCRANAALIAVAPDLAADVIRLTAINAGLVAANAQLVHRLNLSKAEQDHLVSFNADLMKRDAEARADIAGLQEQISKLLAYIDDSYEAENPGALNMHSYGQTPDWYVEAAFWSCYGFSPNDPRAYLAGGK